MKKTNNQKVEKFTKEQIEINLSNQIYKLAKLAIEVGFESPLFMEITKVQCDLIKLKRAI